MIYGVEVVLDVIREGEGVSYSLFNVFQPCKAKLRSLMLGWDHSNSVVLESAWKLLTFIYPSLWKFKFEWDCESRARLLALFWIIPQNCNRGCRGFAHCF